MSAVHLTDDDRDFVATALRLAADQYDMDAEKCSDSNQPRLADQFVYQADKARALAARIESEA